MKRITILFAALLCTAGLFAQSSKLPVVKDIVVIENENTGQAVSVVNIPLDGVNRYFLHVGNMGIGDKIVQVEVDPGSGLSPLHPPWKQHHRRCCSYGRT